jgi:dTDP-4-amino-4,6-dideoxygalactose transaminase|tara:strand:+ start:1027 stop:2112 length:1086 start_codon:yes stop_codon:yes gene_type:complete
MKKIKLFDPVIDENEIKKVVKTMKSKFWASGSGPGNVLKFENQFKKYVGSDDCIAVNSGTSALNLALSLIDIKNKEVILPSLSFVSTAHAILINGGIPIFVDVEPQTMCINPNEIQKSITAKTIAILPVHFAGFPCNLKDIQDIAKKHKLTIIEDAAHAVGTTYSKKKIGSHGTAVCFSFHPVKNLAMPTGGLISINHKNHKQFRKTLLARRWCGITDRVDSKYDVKELGWNYYMNEFSAAIGLTQLKKLNSTNKIRKKIAKIYDKELCLERKIPYSQNCSYHIYWIQVNNRTKFRKKMEEMNIETGIHYRPIHTFTMYKNTAKIPITEKISKKIVSIPIHPNLTENNIDKIIVNVNRFAN